MASKVKVTLTGDQRADSAAVVLLTHLLGMVRRNLPGALADADPEVLHDLRVAVRRTRAAQRELKKVFPPEELARFRSEFRRLQQVTGPVRDLDVHLTDLAGDDLAPARALLLERRRLEREAMVAALGSARTAELLDTWEAFLKGLVERDEHDRPHAAHPIHRVAGKRIVKTYGRLIDEGAAIGDDTPGEALHDLRKTGKELRYLLEFFRSLYPDEVVKPMVKSLKGVQDVLGRHQDREVQVELLRSLTEELADEPGALVAVSGVIERLEQDRAVARDEFADRFAAFAAEGQGALVRETFR